MSQQNKKSHPQSARPAAELANKAARSTFAAAESTRSSAENVVKIGSTAVKEFMAAGAGEAHKAQEKAFAIGREQAEQLSKSADAITKALYETISISRDNVETLVECGNLTASLAKDIGEQLSESLNQAFSEQVELSKEFFACRTFNDMIELQNRAARSTIDNFFSHAGKFSGMLFEYGSEALEPINERVAHATEQLSKVVAV